MKRILLVIIAIILCAASSHASDAVVAKVNDAGITAADIEEEVNRMIPRSTYHGNVSEEKRDEFREKALVSLIERELQYQDALAKGMKPDKKTVKTQMTQIRDRFKSKKEYRAALAQAGITEDGLEARVARGVLVQQVIEKTVAEPAKMNEAALRDYYDKNVTKFVQPESVKLRLISTKDEKKAVEALAKIKAGEDFGNLAATMSEDPYRVKGGDIGYQHRGKLLPEIEDEAFRLKPGEISGLIKAEGLWFIITPEDKKPERQMTFDESKEKLKKELESRRAKEINEKWIAELRAKAKIEMFLKAEKQKTEDRGQKTDEQKAADTKQ